MGSRYRWAVVVVIAAAAIGAIVAITRDREHVQVQTADVTSGPIARRVLVSGTLEPARIVEVGRRSRARSHRCRSTSTPGSRPVRSSRDSIPRHFRPSWPKPKRDSPRPKPNVPGRQAALDGARTKLEDAQVLAGDQQLARAELDLARTTMLQAAAD